MKKTPEYEGLRFQISDAQASAEAEREPRFDTPFHRWPGGCPISPDGMHIASKHSVPVYWVGETSMRPKEDDAVLDVTFYHYEQDRTGGVIRLIPDHGAVQVEFWGELSLVDPDTLVTNAINFVVRHAAKGWRNSLSAAICRREDRCPPETPLYCMLRADAVAQALEDYIRLGKCPPPFLIQDVVIAAGTDIQTPDGRWHLLDDAKAYEASFDEYGCLRDGMTVDPLIAQATVHERQLIRDEELEQLVQREANADDAEPSALRVATPRRSQAQR